MSTSGSSQTRKFIWRFRLEFIVFLIFFLYLIYLRIETPIFSNILILRHIPPTAAFYDDWDFYYLMASDISSILRGEIIAPFCYRLLAPLLAGILPFGLEYNFTLITFISIYFTGILIYFTLRLRFNKFYSIIGLIIFCSFNYSRAGILILGMSFFHYYFFYIYLVDPLALFFIMCCFYSILTSNKKFYMISLILGTLTKEIVLFTIPVFVIHVFFYEGNKKINNNLRKIFHKLFRNSIFIIPGLIVFFFSRLLINPASTANLVGWNDLYQGTEYFSLENIIFTIKNRIVFYTQGYRFVLYTAMTWGSISIGLCIFNKLKTFINWIKLFGLFMTLTYLQLFLSFGGPRVTYIGFFPIIFLSIFGLKTFIEFISPILYKIIYQIYTNYPTLIPFHILRFLTSKIKINFLNKIITNFRRNYSTILIKTIEQKISLTNVKRKNNNF